MLCTIYAIAGASCVHRWRRSCYLFAWCKVICLSPLLVRCGTRQRRWFWHLAWQPPAGASVRTPRRLPALRCGRCPLSTVRGRYFLARRCWDGSRTALPTSARPVPRPSGATARQVVSISYGVMLSQHGRQASTTQDRASREGGGKNRLSLRILVSAPGARAGTRRSAFCWPPALWQRDAAPRKREFPGGSRETEGR